MEDSRLEIRTTVRGSDDVSRLIDPSKLESRGFYRFPAWRPDGKKFGYGTKAATWSQTRGTLYVAGWARGHEIAELRIPDSAPGNEEFKVRLSIEQDLADPAPLLDIYKRQFGLDRLGGIAEVQRDGGPPTLAVTYHKFYAVQPMQEIDSPTLTFRSLVLDGTGPEELLHVGETGLHPYHQKFTANYCCAIPLKWRRHFRDLALLVGKGNGPGSGGGPRGPCLFASTLTATKSEATRVDSGLVHVFEDSFVRWGDTRAIELLLYDKKNPIENWRPTDRWEGCVWVNWQGRDALLFVGSRGQGETWYGAPDRGPNGAVDRWRGGKGYHSEAYVTEFRWYDPSELVKSSRGLVDSHVEPFRIDQLQLSSPANDVGGVAWDPVGGVLYVCETYREDSRLHVWTLPTEPEVPDEDEPKHPEDPLPTPRKFVFSSVVHGDEVFEGKLYLKENELQRGQ